MSPVLSRCLEDLDVYAACGLHALVLSRDIRRPVTPTRTATIRMLEALRTRGIIEVPWPQAQWELPPRGYLAPVEQLGWDYVWKEIELGGLGRAIEVHLDDRCRDDIFKDQLVEVWRELVRAECVEYFEYQLGKHGMDRSWSCDLDWLPKSFQDELSLARWKYLIWSAVRQGAMESLASGFDAAQTRNAIAAMLTNPLRLGYARRPEFHGFAPKVASPHSLMAQFFVGSAAQLGMAYWEEAPSRVGLRRRDVAS